MIGNYYFNLYKRMEDDQLIILYSLTNDFPELEKVGLKKDAALTTPFYKDTSAHLPIFNLTLFMEAINPMIRKRNREKALSEAHMESWADLSREYVLIKYCKSKLSRKLRDYVLEKYTELNDLIEL